MRVLNKLAARAAASGAVAAPGWEHSVRAALAAAIAQLEASGVSSAGLTAELLLMHVLDCDRAWLYAHPEHPLTAPQKALYAQLLARRATGAPTQHLTGLQEFWGLQFEVTPDVLIPRPETEHIVEVALRRLGSRQSSASPLHVERTAPLRVESSAPLRVESSAPLRVESSAPLRVESSAPLRIQSSATLRVADVGTGSGCLAVALARELPHARILATDISEAALEVARRNAARHGVSERVAFERADLLDNCFVPSSRIEPCSPLQPSREDPQFDLIVSNPPYIATRDAATLAREVGEHEPPQALFAGEDGLDFYPRLIAQAETLLGPDGLLVVEVGHSQAASVRAMLDTLAWQDIAIERDLAGIERVISAKRSCQNVSAERR